MRSMTVQERLDDISKRTGMSEDIVRRVLEGESKSIIDSLKRGERATLIGRCTINPELKSRLQIGGSFRKSIKLTANVAKSLESDLIDIEEFEKSSDYEHNTPNGVVLMQLNSLA